LEVPRTATSKTALILELPIGAMEAVSPGSRGVVLQLTVAVDVIGASFRQGAWLPGLQTVTEK